MKLNLGCGVNKKEGYLNIDKYGDPDRKMDLELTPWEFNDNTIDEIYLNHVLEHLGAEVNVFFKIIQEMYRVCKNDAQILINVPHPRHDDFINDPTHVRIITPELLGLFSKKNCEYWKKNGNANSPLAEYLNVDFEIKSLEITLAPEYLEALQSKKISEKEVTKLLRIQNNVASEYKIILKTVK
jgi:SAM-dependent methyltransferase